MVKQIILPVLAVLAFVIIVGLFVQKAPALNIPGIDLDQDSSTVKDKSITIGKNVIRVEVANTADARKKGLSGRSSLDEETGMLFSFDSQNVSPNFWMKDMQIPLDLIWINDGKIVKIDQNAPAPKAGTPDNKLPIFSPGQPVDHVLEVYGGYTLRHDVKVGDSVDLSK